MKRQMTLKEAEHSLNDHIARIRFGEAILDQTAKEVEKARRGRDRLKKYIEQKRATNVAYEYLETVK